MTTAPTSELRTFTELGAIRGDVLDVYAEVRAPLLHLPNYAVTAFGERLDRRLECVNFRDERTQTLDFAFVLGADDLGEKLADHSAVGRAKRRVNNLPIVAHGYTYRQGNETRSDPAAAGQMGKS